MATRKLVLRDLRTVAFHHWQANRSSDARELCVSVSGYETRSTEWARQVGDESGKRRWLVFGFAELSEALSRPANDQFYRDRAHQVITFATDDVTGILSSLTEAVRPLQTDERPLHVHIDYSCMPRAWYCNFPQALEGLLRVRDRAAFWYTPGEYSTAEYPTAGVSDFHVFAGSASLGAKFRTHVLGLGFDRVRAHAICSVLDPQYLLCFYANPAVREDYVRKVEEYNADILRQANLTFTLPIDDFDVAFTRLCSVANEFIQLGDVIFVPDGPKPMIMASSLVPFVAPKPGIVCFHVARRKGRDFQPVDVLPAGRPYGFSFAGSL